MNKTVSPMPSYRMMNSLIYRTGGLKIWTGIKTCFDDNQLISKLKLKLSDSLIRFILYVTVQMRSQTDK